jgi:hypothetical protein
VFFSKAAWKFIQSSAIRMWTAVFSRYMLTGTVDRTPNLGTAHALQCSSRNYLLVHRSWADVSCAKLLIIYTLRMRIRILSETTRVTTFRACSAELCGDIFIYGACAAGSYKELPDFLLIIHCRVLHGITRPFVAHAQQGPARKH